MANPITITIGEKAHNLLDYDLVKDEGLFNAITNAMNGWINFEEAREILAKSFCLPLLLGRVDPIEEGNRLFLFERG